MKYRLVFTGNISIDKIENINGMKIQPGGAALYASIAAKTILNKVTLISAIGKNYPYKKILEQFKNEIKIHKKASSRFHIKYNKKWETNYLKTYLGANPRVDTIVSTIKKIHSNTIIHLSPMQPSKVLKIIKKIKKLKNRNDKISVNTWSGYIKNGRKNKEIYKEIALKTDFFIVSETEAKTLTNTESVITSLKFLDTKMLIITLGSLGAIIKEKKTGVQLIPAFNAPFDKTIDTTGAGDSWCGAFLASYNLTEDWMKSINVASIISSIKCSNWGFKNLLNLRFKRPEDVIEHVLGQRDGNIQKKITNYF